MLRQLEILIAHTLTAPSRILSRVILASVFFGAIQFLLHILLVSVGVRPIADTLMDAFLVGFLFGVVSWVLLAGIQARQVRLSRELEQISELNHEIRNALQVITDAHFDIDAKRRVMVLESVTRIDGVLKRLSSDYGLRNYPVK